MVTWSHNSLSKFGAPINTFEMDEDRDFKFDACAD